MRTKKQNIDSYGALSVCAYVYVYVQMCVWLCHAHVYMCVSSGDIDVCIRVCICMGDHFVRTCSNTYEYSCVSMYARTYVYMQNECAHVCFCGLVCVQGERACVHMCLLAWEWGKLHGTSFGIRQMQVKILAPQLIGCMSPCPHHFHFLLR